MRKGIRIDLQQYDISFPSRLNSNYRAAFFYLKENSKKKIANFFFPTIFAAEDKPKEVYLFLMKYELSSVS